MKITQKIMLHFATHLLRLDGKLRNPRRAIGVPILVVQVLHDLLEGARAHVREAYDPLLALLEAPLEHRAQRRNLEGDPSGEINLGRFGRDQFDVR